MVSAADGTGGGRRGRPRLVDTDRRILDAAKALLRAHGPAAVNIDAVAAASGVARTTIYRRYRSRDELVVALLSEVVATGVPAPALPLREKLHWFLEHVLLVLEEGIGRGGTAAVLTDSDPAFTEALRSQLADRLRALEAVMAGDVEAGRLRADVEPDAVVGMLVGAYLGELLRYGEPRPGWADRTVALLGPALSPTAAPDPTADRP